MKIRCSKEQLELGTQTVNRAVSGKNTIPVLSGIYLKTQGQEIILTATDLEIGIECAINAQVMKEGEIVIPAKYFTEIVKKLPGDEVDLSLQENNILTISSGRSLFQIHVFSSQDFPILPKYEGNRVNYINSDIMRSMIKQTVFATSVSDNRPILTGVYYTKDENNLVFVATNGHRLAYRGTIIQNEELIDSVVIPNKTLQELARLLSLNEEEVVGVSVHNNQVFFDLGKIHMNSRLIEGQFPNYKMVIPEHTSIKVKTKTRLLADAVERCSILGRDGTSNITIHLEGNRLKITGNSPEIGQVYEEIDVDSQGDTIEIAFNARYFLEGLKALEDEEVWVEMSSSLSPAVIKPVNYDYYKYIVMPIRLQ